MTSPDMLSLTVSAIRAEALDVVSLELQDPLGNALPAFDPGAHLEITLTSTSTGTAGSPLIRHYSLCNDPADTHRYQVAVGLAPSGRGGSRHVHTNIRLGSPLQVRPPRNNFPLSVEASHHRFIAGGIGITPILSMIRWCISNNRSWSLLYCARSRLRAAFYEELLAFPSAVRFHFDDEAQGHPADVAVALADPRAGEHVYCCGPQPLMRAVEAAGSNRPPGSLHFEWFAAAPDAAQVASSPAAGFDVLIRSSGARLHVRPDQSILQALEENGISVPYACREGMCRTCETRLCGGEAEHRDFVLSDEEQRAQRSLMVCVSRARTPVLELDL